MRAILFSTVVAATTAFGPAGETAIAGTNLYIPTRMDYRAVAPRYSPVGAAPRVGWQQPACGPYGCSRTPTTFRAIPPTRPAIHAAPSYQVHYRPAYPAVGYPAYHSGTPQLVVPASPVPAYVAPIGQPVYYAPIGGTSGQQPAHPAFIPQNVPSYPVTPTSHPAVKPYGATNSQGGSTELESPFYP